MRDRFARNGVFSAVNVQELPTVGQSRLKSIASPHVFLLFFRESSSEIVNIYIGNVSCNLLGIVRDDLNFHGRASRQTYGWTDGWTDERNQRASERTKERADGVESCYRNTNSVSVAPAPRRTAAIPATGGRKNSEGEKPGGDSNKKTDQY